MHKDRPRITIEKEKIDHILLGVAWIAWLIMILLPMTYYHDLPERIPTHYNAAGEVDGWGEKFELLILVFIGSVLFLGIIILNKYPHLFNYPTKITEENAPKQYRSALRLINTINALVTITFAYLTYGSIQNALGNMEGLGTWFLPIFLILTFGSLAIYLGKCHR